MKLSVEFCSHVEGFEWKTERLENLFQILNGTVPILNLLGLDKETDWTLSVVFMDAKEISELHERFFQDPSPTDVITFPGDPSMGSLGEICVCVEVAEQEAPYHNHSTEREITLYLIHGWLHLTGFDDKTPDDIFIMRMAEAALMKEV